jgi:hypothetical protein
MYVINELDSNWIRMKEGISQKGGVRTYPTLAVVFRGTQHNIDTF